jgi:hypothetical protein
LIASEFSNPAGSIRQGFLFAGTTKKQSDQGRKKLCYLVPLLFNFAGKEL